MNAITRRISILLEMDHSTFQKHLLQVHERFERLKGVATHALAAIGLSFAGVTAAAGLFFKKVLEAGAAADRSLKELEFSARAQGVSWGRYGKELIEFSKSMQKVSVFSDEAVQHGLKRFIDSGFGVEKAMQMMGTAMDLAAGRGYDLEHATEMMVKAGFGVTTMFRRAGIIIDENASKSEKLRLVTEKIAMMWGGQAANAANTFSGQLKQMHNFWEEVLEGMFAFLNQNGGVVNALKLVNSFIQGMAHGFETIAAQMGLLNVAANKDKLKEMFEKGEKLALRIAEKIKEISDWWNTKGKDVFDKIVKALELAAGWAGKIVEFIVDNPKLIAGGALVIGLTKAYGIAKDLVLMLGGITALGLGSDLVMAGRIGFASKSVLMGAGATGILGSSVGAAAAALGPYVIAILAVAGVAAAIYGLWKMGEKDAVTKEEWSRRHEGAPLMRGGVVKADYSDWRERMSKMYSAHQNPQRSGEKMYSAHGGDGGTGENYDPNAGEKKKSDAEYWAKYNEYWYNYDMEALKNSIKLGTEAENEQLKKANEERLMIIDAQRNTEQAQFDLKTRDYDQHLKDKLQLDMEYKWAVEDINSNADISEETRQALLLEKKREFDAKRLQLEDKTVKTRIKLTKAATEFMDRMESNYVGRRISLGKALAATMIQMAGEEVAGWLKAQAVKYLVRAAEAALELNFVKAAGYTALAATAGAGALLVAEGTRSASDRITGANDRAIQDNTSTGGTENAMSGPSSTGYATRGIQNMYVAPTITFIGETMIIGDTGLETAAETIKSIAVAGVKEAIETGVINLGTT